MAGSKVKSSSTSGFGMEGGHSNHMFGKQTVKKQEPGQSAQMGTPAGKYPEGGHGNHMVGKQYANTQEAGCAGHATGSEDTKFGLQTGSKNHMFGKTGSRPARPA